LAATHISKANYAIMTKNRQKNRHMKFSALNIVFTNLSFGPFVQGILQQLKQHEMSDCKEQPNIPIVGLASCEYSAISLLSSSVCTPILLTPINTTKYTKYASNTWVYIAHNWCNKT